MEDSLPPEYAGLSQAELLALEPLLETQFNTHFDATETARALDAALGWVAVARALSHHESHVRALRAAAKAHHTLSIKENIDEHDQAGRRFLEAALAEANALGDPHLVAELSLDIAQCDLNFGRYQQAYAGMEVLLTLPAVQGDPKLRSVVLDGFGAACLRNGRYTQAIETFRESLRLQAAEGSQAPRIRTIFNLGTTYVICGQMEIGMSYLELAGRRYEEDGDLQRIADFWLNYGIALTAAGSTSDALASFLRAQENYQQRGVLPGIVQSTENAGKCLILMADYPAAEQKLKEVVSFRQQLGDEVGDGFAMLGLAECSLGAGDTVQARHYLDRARPGIERIAEPLNQASWWLDSALIHEASAEIGPAIEAASQGLQVYEDSHNVGGTISASLQLQRLYRKSGDIVQATGSAREAFELAAESAKQFSWESGLKNGVASQAYQAGTALAGLLASQGEVAAAFEVAERAKGAPLIQLLAQAQVQSDDPQVQLKLDDYRSTCGRIKELRESLPAQGSDPSAQQQTREQIEALSRHAQDCWAFILERDPRLGLILETRALSVEQVRAEILKPGQYLVEYLQLPGRSAQAQFIGAEPDGLLIFVLGKDTDLACRSVRLPAAAARDLNAWLLEQELALYVEASSAEAAAALSEVLLKPVLDLLPENADLLICPDGNIFSVPFEALPAHRSRMLLETNPVSYMTSATAISYIQRAAQQAPAASLVAGVTFGAAQEWQEAQQAARLLVAAAPSPSASRTYLSAQRDALRQLYNHPLYGVLESTRAIAPLLNTEPLLDAEATEVALRSAMPGKKVIHLATHGLLSASSLLNGVVTYIPPDEMDGAANADSALPIPDSTQDGILQMGEIMGLDLDGTELTVLQCCHGAQGEINPGSGVMGLTQAFIYAGSRRVLASLREVPDASAAELIMAFYANWLTRNLSPEEALRQSKLQYLQSHPGAKVYQWAPFVLYGASE